MSFLDFLKSKTVWGGIITGLSQVLPILSSGMFGPKAQAIGTAAGIILGAVGVKSAIVTAGNNPPPPPAASK